MMEETYRNLPGEDTNKPSGKLLDYFNEKTLTKSENKNLESIFKDSSTNFYKFKYVDETGCFRIEEHNIDFPSNWSVFKNMRQALSNKISIVLTITEFEQNMLYQIMEKFCDYDSKIFLIASSEGVYVAYSRIENLAFEETVNKYFSLVSENKTEDNQQPSAAA